MRLYLTPHLGPILLSELRVGHVQAMFTAISRQDEAEGRPVTPARMRAPDALVGDLDEAGESSTG